VTAALKLLAEGADELAFTVKDKDGRVVLKVLAALVDDVEILVAIHGHVVGGLPREFGRKLGPVVENLVTVAFHADDRIFGEDAWRG